MKQSYKNLRDAVLKIEGRTLEDDNCETCRGEGSWLVECCNGQGCNCNGKPQGPPSFCKECNGTGKYDRDLTLQRLLMALGKDKSVSTYQINNNGDVHLFNPLHKLLKDQWNKLTTLNFSLPIEEQEDEVLDKLTELLT